VEVIHGFRDKVKLIEQPNQGPGAARNAGLHIATGEFIQLQDSDDLFSLNKLEVQAKLLERTGADIAFCPWVKLKIEGNSASPENYVLQQSMPSEKIGLACWWLRGWSTVFQSLLFRRSFLNQTGNYRTDLMPSEDSEFFFRLLTNSPRVEFTNRALMLYRLHNFNKITQDEGVSQGRRIIDWARCLWYMIERIKSNGLKMDFLTRSIFLAGVQKHLRHLEKVPDAPRDLAGDLSAYALQLPAVWLSVIENWQRVREQVRLRTRGSRWMPGYQAGPLTDPQRELIRQLGLEVKPR
jgi:glycosyltransferase involved in cell wall biosynthesis